MELFTTYTVTGDNTDIVWQFKYRLNGLLHSFELLEGELDDKQVNWLFQQGRFPYKEEIIKTWNKMVKNLNVKVGIPDLNFEAFWEAYRHKVKKVMAEKCWHRLSKKDRMLAITYIKTYDQYLARKHVSKAAPSTYLNQRYWEDNHASIH